MAKILLNLLANYNITSNIGYIVADNASSNDTIVDTLFESLEEQGILLNTAYRRLRCCGHIVNRLLRIFCSASILIAIIPGRIDPLRRKPTTGGKLAPLESFTISRSMSTQAPSARETSSSYPGWIGPQTR